MSLIKSSSHFLSDIMLHFHTVLLALCNSYKQPLLPLASSPAIQEPSCSQYLTQPHLVLAVTASSCHPASLTLSPRYLNSLTVYLFMSLLFPHHSITFLPALLPLQYSLHIFCMQNSWKSLPLHSKDILLKSTLPKKFSWQFIIVGANYQKGWVGQQLSTLKMKVQPIRLECT